ncbi:MAG: O-antigen ligase family protein [Pyrinomonadaceae bacterium]|nr:O-antigen ligase family protein [Pyrinomonadaceae bacterium]
MPNDDDKKTGYDSLRSKKDRRVSRPGSSTLRNPRLEREKVESAESTENSYLTNEIEPAQNREIPEEYFVRSAKKADESSSDLEIIDDEGSNFREKKIEKERRRRLRDAELLERDNWLVRNGHSFTFAGLYLFSVLVLFRPYELIAPLSFLSSTAFYFAAVTLAFYLPTQLRTEGNVTILTTEVKAIIALVLLSLIGIPIAKSPGMAWETFNDLLSKTALMFIVMVNVVRSRKRLTAMIWLSLSVGLFLSYQAVMMFWRGELNTEGYRVSVDIGGMFGNPNDLAMHLVMMMPLALTLGIATKKKSAKLIYFTMTALFVAAISVTYSRGGFLGLTAVCIFLSWKLGRNNRLKVIGVLFVAGAFFLAIAPGNYGIRMLSIFIPGLDPVGSSNQRQELLIRSILVTLRNPWGIGIGNYKIVGVRNQETHNAFTQVSSEIGILGLTAYLIFMISPFRKLSAIERVFWDRKQLNWYYYFSIGLQASILGYMVSSFFGAVAYNWYIYYLIAYAVAFRRIYRVAEDEGAFKADEDVTEKLKLV